MTACIIPTCRREGIWILGLRARLVAGASSPSHPDKKATDAAWAPNLPARLCDQHAFEGAALTLIVEPRSNNATEIRVIGAADWGSPERSVSIR